VTTRIRRLAAIAFPIRPSDACTRAPAADGRGHDDRRRFGDYVVILPALAGFACLASVPFFATSRTKPPDDASRMFVARRVSTCLVPRRYAGFSRRLPALISPLRALDSKRLRVTEREVEP
jgi:hypothetical protein